MSFIQKLFTSYHKSPIGNTRIGELNRIWYDSITNTLRIQLDNTPGGTVITGGSGSGTQIQSDWTQTNTGALDFIKHKPDLSVYATTTYVTNLLDNYNDLGDLSVVKNPDPSTAEQTISGAINGADIILNPNNGAVQVPELKVGSGGNILNTSLFIEAFITTYELVSIVDSSTGPSDDLVTGTYGNINGVEAPWTVFELAPGIGGIPISAVQINDILTGVGIIPSTVKDRGLAGIGDPTEWNNYIIVNLDLAGLGQVLPLTGSVFNLTRPLEKGNFNIQSATGTDIFLDSQGQGDVIVNTNILPVTNNISTLGTPTRRWQSIYLGPGTIYVFDETLGKDIAIGARDGLLYVQNGAGLSVGEFTFIDNQIKITNPDRDIIIGTTDATGYVEFNRPIKIQNNLGQKVFEISRTGLTSIYTPSGINYQNATLSIIGTNSGHIQPRPLVFDGTLLQLTAQDGKSSRISSDSFGTGVYPLYAGRAARGDVDHPSALQLDDVISRFSAAGYGTTGYVSSISRIDAVAAENFTDTTAGTKFTFQNAAVGTTAIGLSATIDRTGLSFFGNSTGGITFSNTDRLTYFPTPVGNPGAVLASNGTTMSWQIPATFSGAVIYKGSWNADTNTTPSIDTDGKVNGVAPSSGFEYSISATGTQNIGAGSQEYATGGFIIYNGTLWEYIPPISGVASIKFDGGSAQTGAVSVVSSDIISTLDSNSIGNIKLAYSSVTVTAGTGLSGGGTVALGASITLTNAGVLSITTNTGLSTNVSATGNVTITNTGVLSVASGGHITATTVSGVVTLGSDATTNATNNTIALRDSIGGIEAKDFTATLDAGITTDHGPFNYGVLSYSDTGIMADFSYSANSYNQVVLQNRNAGNSASTNYIVSNNQGTASEWYGEFGMNSSGFSGTGSLALPNAVYLNSVSSDLVLGGSAIHFVIAAGTDSVSIDSSGVATFANQIVGSISGSANNTRHALTFAATGGASAGATFDGSTAKTIDYSTIGAQVAGTYVTSVTGTSGRITSTGGTTPAIDLVTGIATPGTYGSGTLVPVVTVDTYGRVTNITTVSNPLGTVTSIATGTNNVSGITLSGGPITSSGTISLSGSISGLTNSNLSGTAGITNANLATPTISGVQLGNNLATLTISGPLTGTSYNGSSAVSIGIPQATGSVSGYLTSTDWTTFNNKTSNTGTVTSVSGTGTVNGLTLTGTVTTTGSLTLGGTLSGITNSNLSGTAGITNANLANSSVTVTAGTGMSGGGTVSLGGSAITLTNAGVLSITTNTGLSTNVSATGNVTITNTGVTSLTTSSGLSTNTSATGAVSITNTGVTSIVAGTNITVSGATGAVTINAASNGVGGNQLVYVLNNALTLTATNGTTQSIFGLTNGVTLASNTRYVYEIVCTFGQTGASHPDFLYSLALGGTTVLAKHAYQVENTGVNNRTDNAAGITLMSNDITTGFTTPVITCNLGANWNPTVIWGTIDVTTGGTVNFMITNNKGTANFQVTALSQIRLTPVGAIGANTAAGTWA